MGMSMSLFRPCGRRCHRRRPCRRAGGGRGGSLGGDRSGGRLCCGGRVTGAGGRRCCRCSGRRWCCGGVRPASAGCGCPPRSRHGRRAPCVSAFRAFDSWLARCRHRADLCPRRGALSRRGRGAGALSRWGLDAALPPTGPALRSSDLGGAMIEHRERVLLESALAPPGF